MTAYPEFEAIIKNCDKIRIDNFLKTLFRGDSKGTGKFGGTEQPAADGITILGSVTLFTQDGRPKPVLCCAKQMDGILTERSSRRKQFDIAVKVLKDNFVNPYMGNGPIQGSFTQGLFFFFDEPGNFRLSLVTAEISAGRMELNNYRRQSFFVEAGKNNKTFRTRLCKTIANYDELKSAFDVEKLSDEFFREYKVFYEDIVQYITGARYIEVKKNKYERKDMSGVNHEIYDQFVEIYGDDAERAVRNYVKKLMGRLVFIQFLQKKGWLGNLAGANTWSSGDRDFMQSLFLEVPPEDRENFIDNVLEEIFFGEFNTKENERHIKNATLKKYRFPFLNCGLFDRDSDDKLDFKLPAAVFCNLKFPDTERKAPNIKDWSKKRNPYFDDRACGLFDFFDRFNFTIDENDPTDAEVSVDPEMLGKIFENLLEDNKDKGAFYTPKEIVNYMVNESLIAYLETECSKVIEPAEMTESRIRNFVLTQDTSAFTDSEKMQLDVKLAEVKICDPAIGSGAFPMGLLNLLCKCRQSLQPIEKQNDKKTIAALKRDIIQQNIYGVDIEKGAVDIARLRFWLSLIVDEDTPEVLPNLEFKIMQGNSLLESYEGIDLSGLAGERGTRERGASKVQISMVFDEKQAMEQIQKDLNKFYKTDSHAEKESLTLSINNNVREYIKYIAPQKSKEIDAMPVPNDKFFLWHTYFRDVFSRKGKEGFDIVIGNPPYVNVQLMTDEEKSRYRDLYSVFIKRCDLFALFVEHGLEQSSKNGVVTFIIPSVVHSNMSYTKLRDMILNNRWLREVCYTGGDVFHAPTVDTTILICNKKLNNSITLKNAVDFNNPKVRVVPANYFSAYNNIISVGGERDSDSLFAKLLDSSLVKLDQKFTIYQGIVTGNNPAFIFETEKKALDKGIDKELLHPFCHGRDIEKFMIRSRQRRILYIDNSTNIEKYPTTKRWLSKFKEKLLSRREAKKGTIQWCSLQWPREKKDFDLKEKILVQRTRNEALTTRVVATLDDDSVYGSEGIYFLIPKTKDANLHFLLGILNSKPMNYLFATKFLNLAIKAEYVKQLRLPPVSPAQQKPIIDLVDSILAAKKKDPSADTSKLEEEIDNLVYDLYGLTPEEIAIVKGGSPAQNDDGEKARSDKPHETHGSVADDDFLQGEDL